ncbi:hypothetical protein GcC1_024035, partial [Golovinomyces cichoracearum]
ANVRVNVAKGLVNRYSQDSDAYSSTESIASGYLCVASLNSEPSETKKSQLEDSTKLSWLLDTAASQHITNRKDVFEKSIQSSNQQIIVANGQIIQAQGRGSILIPWESSQAKPKLLRIRDVLYVPQASENLLSLGQLNKNGISFRTDKNGIILEKNNKLWARGTRYHRIYHLNQPHIFQKAFSTDVITERLMKKSDQEIIHARLRAPWKIKHCFCEVCAKSKIARKIERRSLPKAIAKLKIFYINFCGPFPEKSLLGNYYMLTQTCQATGRSWLKFSPTKKDIVKKVIECFEEGEADAQKEELEELCKNEGFKINSPTINNDSDDGESTVSLEDHPRMTSLNRQSCQQPITNHYENENDHSKYQTQENISTSDLGSTQNLELRSTPNNLPESLETLVPKSPLALEEPL